MLTHKIKKSYKMIKHYASISETPLMVNFSGGKDSSAMLLLTLDVADNVEAMYMDSGTCLPGTVEFVKSQAKKLGVKLHISHPGADYNTVPYKSLEDLVRKYQCFPVCMNPWCSKGLKLRPGRRYLRQIYGKQAIYKLVGVRKSESSRRGKLYDFSKNSPKYAPVVDLENLIRVDGEHSGSFICYPILHWDKYDILQFLEDRKFEIDKNYKPFGVSGCAWCPFYQRRIYESVLWVYPNIYDSIIELEDELGKPSVTGHTFLRDIKKAILQQQKFTSYL